MNRFYYLDMYNRFEAKQENKEIDVTVRSKEMQAAFECFYIFKRIEDLTGELNTWPEPREDSKMPHVEDISAKDTFLTSATSIKGAWTHLLRNLFVVCIVGYGYISACSINACRMFTWKDAIPKLQYHRCLSGLMYCATDLFVTEFNCQHFCFVLCMLLKISID